MANEYRLNYTASDIDAKLGVIDGTKTYYASEEVDEKISASAPEIDDAPVEGSENLVTSGGVYDALQTAGGASEWEDIKNKPGDKTTVSLNDIYDLSSGDDIVEEGSVYNIQFAKCDIPISNTISASIKHRTTGEITNLGSCELSSFDFNGSETILGSINTTTTFEDLVSGVTTLEKDNTNPAAVVAFVKDYNRTFIIVDISNYADYEFIISYDTEGVIGLPETVLGEEFENINGKLSLALGKTITIEKEINNSYTTTLGTPNSTPPTSPFLIWNNVVKDKQIYDDIQDGTPVKVSYIENDETIEIGTYDLFSNSTLDTQFGMGSNSTGYYGFVNAAQSLEEVLTQGVWTRADLNKPTFTLVFAKSNTSGQSWLQIAAPESLTDITFTVEISTTGTEIKTIKLSNEAINVDEVPTEGSTNFLTSGAIKSALSSVDVELPQNVSYFTNDANYQNWEQVNESINTKANEIEGKIPTVPTNLSSFTNDMNYQTSNDINTAINNVKTELNTSISGKAPSSHNHDNLYYSQSIIETKLTNKQDKLNLETEPKDGNTNPITSGGVYNAIVDVIEIAEGKRKSYVFDDVAALDLWLAISTNVDLLQIGDVFLLRSTIEPDYWWDGSTKQILDTNMDLDGYATTEYVDDKFGDVDTAIAHLRTLIGGASE